MHASTWENRGRDAAARKIICGPVTAERHLSTAGIFEKMCELAKKAYYHLKIISRIRGLMSQQDLPMLLSSAPLASEAFEKWGSGHW